MSLNKKAIWLLSSSDEDEIQIAHLLTEVAGSGPVISKRHTLPCHEEVFE